MRGIRRFCCVSRRLSRSASSARAITSREKTLEGAVSLAFGRAPCFIIVDTDTGDFEVIDNEQIMNIPQGAGIQAAQHIINKGVDTLISGHIGPKAFRVLSEAGIRMFVGASGTVKNTLEDFKQNKLTEASKPDVEGHWV